MKVRASVKRIDPDRYYAPRQQHHADKNPLHPSALRLRDIHVGLEFIIFTVWGEYSYGRIVSEPYMGRTWAGQILLDGEDADPVPRLVVDIVTMYGFDTISLEDDGVMPWIDETGKVTWNDRVCMVRASKAHTLPGESQHSDYPSRADEFDIYEGVGYESPEMPPVTEADLR